MPGIIQPKDKGILLENILEGEEVDRDKCFCLDANYFNGTNAKQCFLKTSEK